MVLDSDCATIKLNIGKTSDGFQVESIETSLVVPNYDAHSCRVEGEQYLYPPIKQVKGSHPKESGLVYRCRNTIKNKDGQDELSDIVYISFNSLEFELYGDPVRTENDEFTTPAAAAAKPKSNTPARSVTLWIPSTKKD